MLTRRWLMMTLIAGLTMGVAASGANGAVLPKPMRVDVLPNGLTVVMVPWDSPGIAVYQTTVRVGSRDEVEADHTGFAHLFEHMMFRGTARYPKDVYERETQLSGADNNAFTWFDLTNYFLLAPRDTLPKLIDIEADRFQRLLYSESDFRTETGAVLGEYNKNASSPGLLMEEALLETAFTGHTYAHSTMGYLADIEKMPGYYEYSQQFLRRYYTPDNCFLVLVGDFDQEEALEHIRKGYGAWEGKRDTPTIPEEPPQTEPRSRHVDWASPTAPRMTLAYKIPAYSTATIDSAGFDVIHELAFGSSSPLYRKLVLEEKKVLSLSSPGGIWSPYAKDPFLFMVEVTLQPGTRFEEVEAAVTAELARLARGEVGAERVAAVRSHLRYAFLTELETPEDVALTLAMFISATGDAAALEAHPDQLAAVTAEDVKRLATTYLVPEGRTIVTLSHEREGGAR